MPEIDPDPVLDDELGAAPTPSGSFKLPPPLSEMQPNVDPQPLVSEPVTLNVSVSPPLTAIGPAAADPDPSVVVPAGE